MAITEKEFNEFLKQYDLEDLTDDDIFEIGVKHKETPRGTRNWNDLNDKIGHKFLNGECYRCWVKEELKEKGQLPKNVKMLTEGTIQDLEFADAVDEFEKQKAELYKQQIKTRDAQREYRTIMRNDARRENLMDTLYELLKNEDPIKLKSPALINGKKEAILILSDWHLGCTVENFYNTFNLEIAIERIEKLRDYTISYCKNFNIGKLYVVGLGDMVENGIHVTARVTNEMNIVGQIKKASELISELLLSLSEYVGYIEYRSIQGNHDRVIQNYKESLANDNFNTLIDDMVVLKVKIAGAKNIHFNFDNLGDAFGVIKLENGKLLGFTHGDKIAVDKAYQSFCGALKTHVDYVILGHRHCVAVKEFNAAKVIAAGSLKGTDEYALTKNLFSKPSQTMLIFDDDADINITINLD